MEIRRDITMIPSQPSNTNPFHNENPYQTNSTPLLISQYEVKTEFYNNTNHEFVVRDRLNFPMAMHGNKRQSMMQKARHEDALIIVKTYRFHCGVVNTVRDTAKLYSNRSKEFKDIHNFIDSHFDYYGGLNKMHGDISFSFTYYIEPAKFTTNDEGFASIYVEGLDLVVSISRDNHHDLALLLKQCPDHPYHNKIDETKQANTGFSKKVTLVDHNREFGHIFVRAADKIIRVNRDTNNNVLDGIYVSYETNGIKHDTHFQLDHLIDDELKAVLAAHDIYRTSADAQCANEIKAHAELIKAQTELQKAITQKETAQTNYQSALSDKDFQVQQFQMKMDTLEKEKQTLTQQQALQLEQIQFKLTTMERERENLIQQQLLQKQQYEAKQSELIASLEAARTKAAMDQLALQQKAQYEHNSLQQKTQYEQKSYEHNMSTISRKETSEVRKHKSDTWKYVVGITASVIAVGASIWKWFSGK